MLGSCNKDEVNVAQLEGTKWTLVKIEYLFNGETVYSTTDTKEAEVSHKLSFENGNLTYYRYGGGDILVEPYSIVENVIVVSSFWGGLTRWGDSGNCKVVKLSNKELVIEPFVNTIENVDEVYNPSTYKGVPIHYDFDYGLGAYFYDDSYYFESKGYGYIEVYLTPSGEDFYDTGRLYYKVMK